MTGIRGRRGKQIPDDLKKNKGYRKFEQEALERFLRRINFGRGYGSVMRQNAG